MERLKSSGVGTLKSPRTDHTYPGKIYKVNLGAGATAPIELGPLTLMGGTNANPADGNNVLNSPPTLYGEVFLQSAITDPASGYSYFGTDSAPGQVVKVALSEKGALKATKVTLAVTANVTDVRFYSHAAAGNARLAIYDNAAPKNLLWDSGSVVNTASHAWLTVPTSAGTP